MAWIVAQRNGRTSLSSLSRPTRLIFIEEDAEIGGAELNLLGLLERIPRDRFHPSVVVPFEGPLTTRLKEIGVPFHVLPRRKLKSVSSYVGSTKVLNPFTLAYDVALLPVTIWKLSRLLKKERVDLVHTNSMVAHVYGGIAARLGGVPCVWHVQDIIEPQLALGAMRRVFANLAARLPTRIVVVSKAVGEMFSGGKSFKVSLVYNGVDVRRFSPQADGAKVRREFGIAGDELVVGILGRLVPWKGHREFLLAAARVSQSVPITKFLIIGDTTFGAKRYEAKLRSLCAELGITAKVVFTGARRDTPEILRALDVLVHASVSPEPFGLVIIEAMASGVPVVASSQGGPLEIIEHGKDGFLVDPRDTVRLADQVLALLRDRGLQKRLGLAGREKVVNRFSLEAFARSMERIYLEALPKVSRPNR